MVQFSDSVVMIPDGLDPYTLPLHPDGTYVDCAESLSAESLGLDGLDSEFQDAAQGDVSMSDFDADPSMDDAMVFSDSFVADEDFSSMSDSEATLEKEPPQEMDALKQAGLNAGLAAAVGMVAPAIMKVSSRMLNSTMEPEDLASDSAVFVHSFNNSASFSQMGNASGAFQGGVAKSVMQQAMLLAARSASNSVGQGSVVMSTAASGAGGALAGTIGGTFGAIGVGMNVLFVTAVATTLIGGALVGLQTAGFLRQETRAEVFVPLNISFADFDVVPSPSSVPSHLQSSAPWLLPSSSQLPTGLLVDTGSLSPTTMPGEILSNKPTALGSLQPTQLSPDGSASPTSQSPSLARLETSAAPSPLSPFSAVPSVTPSLTGLTAVPSVSPSGDGPSLSPLSPSSAVPSVTPSLTGLTAVPSVSPSGDGPSLSPLSPSSAVPSVTPSLTELTAVPSVSPSGDGPSPSPLSPSSAVPSVTPSLTGLTAVPSVSPSGDEPSASPIRLSASPTGLSLQPTEFPTGFPAGVPSSGPSEIPDIVTDIPSVTPSVDSSTMPTGTPSAVPIQATSQIPTAQPSPTPISEPSTSPSAAEVPSPSPTISWMPAATQFPSDAPTRTSSPSAAPSVLSSSMPSADPTVVESATPSGNPTKDPSRGPSSAPTDDPTVFPSSSPTSAPTSDPSSFPSSAPTKSPTSKPSPVPSLLPTSGPTDNPTAFPSVLPSIGPTSKPIAAPTPPTPTGPTEIVGSIVSWELVSLDTDVVIASLTNGAMVDLCAYQAPVTVKAVTLGTVGQIEFKMRTPDANSVNVDDKTDPFTVGDLTQYGSSVVINAIPFLSSDNKGNRGNEVQLALNFNSNCSPVAPPTEPPVEPPVKPSTEKITLSPVPAPVATPPSPAIVGSIVGWQLVSSDTDIPIAILTNGALVDLCAYQTPVTVKAVTLGTVGQIEFKMRSPDTNSVNLDDDVSPFHVGDLTQYGSSVVINAIPFLSSDNKGNRGNEVQLGLNFNTICAVPVAAPVPAPTIVTPPVAPPVPTNPAVVGSIVGWQLVSSDTDTPIAILTNGALVDLCAYQTPVTVKAVTLGTVGQIEFKMRTPDANSVNFDDDVSPFHVGDLTQYGSSVVINAIPFLSSDNKGNRGNEVQLALNFNTICAVPVAAPVPAPTIVTPPVAPPVPTSPAVVGSIVGWQLVSSDTDTPIAILTNGALVDLCAYQTPVTVKAVTLGTVGQIEFKMRSPDTNSVNLDDDVSPFHVGDLTQYGSSVVINAIPFLSSDNKGNRGNEVQLGLNFNTICAVPVAAPVPAPTIVTPPVAPPVPTNPAVVGSIVGWQLVSSDTDTPIAILTNGALVDLCAYQTPVTVKAVTLGTVGQIEFKMRSPDTNSVNFDDDVSPFHVGDLTQYGSSVVINAIPFLSSDNKGNRGNEVQLGLNFNTICAVPVAAPVPAPTIVTPPVAPPVPTSPGTVGKIVGWQLVSLNTNAFITDLTNGGSVDLCNYQAPVTVKAVAEDTVNAIEFKIRAPRGPSVRVYDNSIPFHIGDASQYRASVVINAIPFPSSSNLGGGGDEVSFALTFLKNC